MENDIHRECLTSRNAFHERVVRYNDVDISTSISEQSNDVAVDIALRGNLYISYRIIDTCHDSNEDRKLSEARVIHGIFVTAIKATIGNMGAYQSRFAASVDKLVRPHLECNGYTENDIIQTITPMCLSEQSVNRIKELMPVSHVGESSLDQLLSVYALCDTISSLSEKFDADMRRILDTISTNVPDAIRLLTEIKIKASVNNDASNEIIEFHKKCSDVIQLRLLRDKNIKNGNIPLDVSVDFTCGEYEFPPRIKMMSSFIYECVDTIGGVLVRTLKPFETCENDEVRKIVSESDNILRYS